MFCLVLSKVLKNKKTLYNKAKVFRKEFFSWLKKNLYSENGMMKKVEKKMKNFMRELDSILYYNHEEFWAAELEELKEEAVRIAKEEAYKEGSKQSKIEMAKKMLDFMNIEQIEEITGLSLKEIDQLNS